MRILFLALFTCSLFIKINAQQPPAPVHQLIEKLGREFANDTATAGLSVGIRYKGQEWFYNFGKDDPGIHSVYEIGSLTKTFTALVLAHAVTEGKINLNDDVRKYLEGDYSNLQYKGEPIRIVHLANTTSALPENLPAGKDTGFTKADFFRALATAKPDTLPGTKPRHCNSAATLLSYLLETVYHEPIDALVKKYVLDPLQMTETYFSVPTAPEGLMTGHNQEGKTVPPFSSIISRGTGGMRSTTTDLVKYLACLEEQTSPQVKMALAITVSVDAATNHSIPLVPIETIDDRTYALSLTWLQYHPGKGDLRIWTDGGTAGFRSYIVMYPEQELSMVFLSNRTGEKMLDKIYTICSKISNGLKAK